MPPRKLSINSAEIPGRYCTPEFGFLQAFQKNISLWKHRSFSGRHAKQATGFHQKLLESYLADPAIFLMRKTTSPWYSLPCFSRGIDNTPALYLRRILIIL
ncbi:MAG: hypothetical protein NC211_08125 [Alistipes senegalensis]|nr:hypothetical protein [Oxalobacter formigenes]MCM1281773.1 hypothetical protein [Alistipes senegalensis]